MSIMSNMQRVSLLRNVPIRSPTTGAVEQRLQSVGSIDMAIYQDDTLRISQTVQGDVTSHIGISAETAAKTDDVIVGADNRQYKVCTMPVGGRYKMVRLKELTGSDG